MKNSSQKNDGEYQIVLRHPVSGLGLITHEQGLECIQPGVGSLDDQTALIQLIVKQIVMISPASFVDGYVWAYFQTCAKIAHLLAIQASVCVEEQAPVFDVRPAQRADDFRHAFLDLEQVAVVARYRLGAGQRNALAVG